MSSVIKLAIRGASAFAQVPVTKNSSGEVTAVGTPIRYDNINDASIALPVPASAASATSPEYLEWNRIDGAKIKYLKTTKNIKGEDGSNLDSSGGSSGSGTASKITVIVNSLPIGVTAYKTHLSTLQNSIGSDFICGIGLGLDESGNSLGVGYLYGTLTNAIELKQAFDGAQTVQLEFTGKELKQTAGGKTAIEALSISSITPVLGVAVAFPQMTDDTDLTLGKFIFL